MSQLDKLYSMVSEYRQSKTYAELLRYISGFKNLSPYNAFLVLQQRPGSRYVLSPEDWKAHGRDIRRHARPIVILRPFGPVEFVYDVSDTVPAQTKQPSLFERTDDEIVEYLSAPYRTRGPIPYRQLDTLIENIGYYGIAVEPYHVGSQKAAEVRVLDEKKDSHIQVCVSGKRGQFFWPAMYGIHYNSNADVGETFASICHELGHIFCGHMKLPSGVSQSLLWHSTISHQAKEFEAESVAWLTCSHFEIYNPSEKYLADYVDEHYEIPEGVSVERIFYAANIVIKLSSQMLSYREGWLYRYDKEFKKASQVMHIKTPKR